MKALCAAAIALMPLQASADEITDTLISAIEAYQSGDIQYALEELAYAQQQLKSLKTADLVSYLPQPDGWTREVNTDMNAGLSMMGGGIGAEANYSNGTDTVTLTLMADNPMVVAMAGMVQNAGLMGLKIVRVGRQKFIAQDDELTALIGGRLLVQASGADTDTLMPLLEAIDYQALADFGQ